jgi:hypothetical protein
MYAFANRADCTCVDEPLYAAHLAAHPHLARPYKEALTATQGTDGSEVRVQQSF